MIINPEMVQNKFTCNKFVADYLIKKHLPILGINGNDYYFAKTKEFYEVYANLPVIYKIFMKSGL